jgi:hypothetical protein
MSDNVITFPHCRWDGRHWWHGGKNYVHLGKLKALCTAAEWRRIYEYDLRRRLRAEVGHATGPRAA